MMRSNSFVCDQREALEAAKTLMQFYSNGALEINPNQAANMMR
jgi:hypothetical protein